MNNELLKEMRKEIKELDEIRKQLLDKKDEHINFLKEELDYTATEALRDWQLNFINIVDAMDRCTQRVRSKLYREEN